jgi:hypothetical protein
MLDSSGRQWHGQTSMAVLLQLVPALIGAFAGALVLARWRPAPSGTPGLRASALTGRGSVTVTRASDDAAATRMLRAAAARRLLELDAAGQLTAGHVRLAVSSVGLSGRTMWRWLGRGRSTGQVTPLGRARFVAGGLTYWRGTVAALHRELVAAAAAAARRRRAWPPCTGRSRGTCRLGSAPGCARASTPPGRSTCSCSARRPTATRHGKPTMWRRPSRSTSRGSSSGRG